MSKIVELKPETFYSHLIQCSIDNIELIIDELNKNGIPHTKIYLDDSLIALNYSEEMKFLEKYEVSIIS